MANQATVVVLSRGMQLRLQIDPATLKMLDERAVTPHLARTDEAVENRLAESEPVGGLFHSTCEGGHQV